MKKVSRLPLNAPQRGQSLVEIMIALTIGIVILLAVTSFFVVNRNTYRATDDKSRLDEEGRLALDLMAFHVRMAGYGTLLSSKETVEDATGVATLISSAVYTNYGGASGTASNAIRGCDGGFSNVAAAVVGIACTGGTATPDAFLVRYVVDANTSNTTTGGLPTDCLGAAVTQSPDLAPDERKNLSGSKNIYLVENRFYIANTNGVPELYCIGNGGTAVGANMANPGQPIAENVEQMRISYGVASGNKNASGNSFPQAVDRYLTATNVGANWDRVVSAKICIVVRSANDNIVLSPQTYTDCTNTQVLAADRRLRSVFSTTVAIRSRSVGAS